MSRYAALAAEPIPQTEPLDARQVPNSAGGYAYALDDWKRLERFLILGSDAPTYYTSAQKLTRENAKCVERCFAADPIKAAATIVDISKSGRAAKNDAAIFALAIGACMSLTVPKVGALSTDDKPALVTVRSVALGHLAEVCRTSTHLFQFLRDCRALGRGWGRALKRAVAAWYTSKSIDDVAYQAIKYRQREGYTHQRALELSHAPSGDDPARRALYRWMKGKPYDGAALAQLPMRLHAHIQVMKPDCTVKYVVDAVREYDLPWEALPTGALNDPEVWRALLPKMGLTAMVRELARMTEIGVLKPLASEVKIVATRLADREQLRRARIHPLNLLQALAVYRSGQGFRGSRTWAPVQPVADALERAFYLAFEVFEPAGKRTLIGVDVSGSMSSPLGGTALTVAEAAAAMAMVAARTEPAYHIMGFAHEFRDLGITAADSLATVLRKTSVGNFGSTDCSLPMLYALEKGLEVDVFQVITDNETYAGRIHPAEALRRYRQETGIPARLVVMGMTATQFSIADPSDSGMLDVVGFDAAAPSVVANFCRN